VAIIRTKILGYRKASGDYLIFRTCKNSQRQSEPAVRIASLRVRNWATEETGLFLEVVGRQLLDMALLNEIFGALLSLPVLVCCFLLYGVGLSIYRLVFSPLAKFPGPKLAAATSWYEFYYNVIKGGQFTFHLQSLHDKYGK